MTVNTKTALSEALNSITTGTRSSDTLGRIDSQLHSARVQAAVAGDCLEVKTAIENAMNGYSPELVLCGEGGMAYCRNQVKVALSHL